MNIDDIREFDPMTMKEIGNSAIWYAPSSGGKTISCTHVLSKVGKWYDEIYLFSKTAHCQTGAFKFHRSSKDLIFPEGTCLSINWALFYCTCFAMFRRHSGFSF